MIFDNIWFGDQDYESKRDFLAELLAKVGFQIQSMPKGSIFFFAELPETCTLSDVSSLCSCFQLLSCSELVGLLVNLLL